MSDSKKITFQVQDENDRLKAPEWSELEAENNICPICNQAMIPILGYLPDLQQSILYAHCLNCKKLYIGE